MKNLASAFLEEKNCKYSGGLYHYTQINLAYNSNHIEGNSLSEEQTRYIYETNSIISDENTALNVDDIIETSNHFKAFNYILDNYNNPLTPGLIKEIHFILKSNTSQANLEWFNVGDYKKRANFIGSTLGGIKTTSPAKVSRAVDDLLDAYNQNNNSIDDIIDFHYRFE